MLVYYKHLFP